MYDLLQLFYFSNLLVVSKKLGPDNKPMFVTHKYCKRHAYEMMKIELGEFFYEEDYDPYRRSTPEKRSSESEDDPAPSKKSRSNNGSPRTSNNSPSTKGN